MRETQRFFGYEVGLGHPGHPSPAEKAAELQRYLDKYGTDPDLWVSPPEILEQHVAVGVTEYGRGPLAVSVPECAWAVYGVLKDKPADDPEFVPEGVRIATVPLEGS